jgi:hypothetical protein
MDSIVMGSREGSIKLKLKKENKTMNEMMKKLNDAVKHARDLQAKKWEATDGGLIKMYASRKRTSTRRYYLEDRETRDIMQIMQDAIQKAFNIKPSRTILIRRAMLAYFDKFSAFMLTGRTTEDIKKFLDELYAEKEAILSAKKR